jgi:hypothetical protein
MKLPDPTPGLVIRFDYTLYKDKLKKERTCAIVLADRYGHGCSNYAFISRYWEEGHSLQVTKDLCKAMGLDEDINYVRLNEVNRFAWPSDLIKPLPK